MFNLNNQKINLLLILLFSGLIILLSPNWVKAADCGGATSCYCGDTVVEDATITEDLNCDENVTVGLTVMANLYLQANITMANTSSQALVIGASGTSTDEPLIIQGNGTSTITGTGYIWENTANHVGIYNNGYNYIKVKDLIVTEFSTGILFKNAASSIIENTTTTHNQMGIGLDSCTAITLQNNQMTENDSNLWISGSDLSHFEQINIDTSNKVEGKSVYYLVNANGTSTDDPLVYGNTDDMGMFACVSCEYVRLENVTLAPHNYAAVVFINTNSSTIDSVVANSNDHFGIVLSNSSNNTITNSITENNRDQKTYFVDKGQGIYLTNSHYNNIINNRTNNNGYGIVLDNSQYNNLTTNLVRVNDKGIVLLGSSNNVLTNNKTIFNSEQGIFLYNSPNNQLNGNWANFNGQNGFAVYNSDNSTFTNNRANFNGYHNMLQLSSSEIGTTSLNQPIAVIATMKNLAGANCSDCSYDVSLSPTETTASTSQNGVQITTSFTSTHSGIYSLRYQITDNDGNTSKGIYTFLVDPTSSYTTRYYLRGIEPTHGQMPGHDSKSLLLEPPTSAEEWRCGVFVQNSPDIQPPYPFANLSSIDINSWYKMVKNGYIGVQRYFSYGSNYDYKNNISFSPDYSFINTPFTDLNWPMNYQWSWYYLALKLKSGTELDKGNPYWLSSPASTSYADFTYYYTTTPAVKSIDNDFIVLLSATADPNNTNQVSLVLENPLDAATSTNLVLDNFHQAFLTGTAVIDSTGSTTLNTGSIDAGATTSFASVPLFLTPSAGSVSVVVNTWQTSDTYYKQWTETGSQSNISTAHTVGDLKPNTAYVVKVDNSQYGVYTSNSQGEISFTYNGGYSSKTFEIVESTQGAAVPPPPPGGGGGTTAATTETNLTQLQDEINRLTSLINWLKAKLAEIFGGAGAATVSIPEDCQFTATLKYGDTNNEVKCLQLFLKSQGASIYPEGKVTGYFGSLTKNAVMRFQEKYAQEILTPAGFTKPTGIVGKYTNAKIRQILGK